MQRVIGLDIGSYSIKVVEIHNTFNSYEIVNFYENVIPYFEEADADSIIPASMGQLFRENNLQADRIITAMPGQYISSRIMSFNFSDPRKIENAVLAEVEDVVPYNLEDMIVDHQVIGQIGGQTIAMVVMTRKEFMRSFLEHLQYINIDPKLVDVDSLAFYNLNPYLQMEPGECAAIVDVGHEKTSVCIVQNDVLRMFRSINLGGRYLTEFLARDLEVGFNEAQRIKHQISKILYNEDVGEEMSSEERMISHRMTLACNAMVKELGRTFYSFKKWEKTPISKIFLSGGTSKIINLDNYLSEQLEIKVIKNRLDQSNLKINPDLNQYREIMPQSIAIGVRAVSSLKRHTLINLRKGEFAYVQNYESIFKITGGVFKYMAVGLLMLCVIYTLRYFDITSKNEKIQDDYNKKVVKVFPDLQKSQKNASFKRMSEAVKAKFNSEINAKNTFYKNKNRSISYGGFYYF